MRTTINLDDGLLAAVKKKAAERSSTVSRLIEDSLRLTVLRHPEGEEGEEPFDLVTFGEGGRFTRCNVDKTSVLLELDDLERFGPPDR